MTTSNDELREHLVAAIEAAPELPKESREHLADVFLDELHAEYDLVPRGTGRASRQAGSPGRSSRRRRWVPIALAIAFLVFVVPAAAHLHFVPFVLFLVAVFFVVRRMQFAKRSF